MKIDSKLKIYLLDKKCVRKYRRHFFITSFISIWIFLWCCEEFVKNGMFNSATIGTWNNSSALYTTGFTAASTIGQVITRNQLGWSIDRNISCKDDDFLLVRLNYTHNIPMFVYSEKEDMYVSRDIIYTGGHKVMEVNSIMELMSKFPDSVFVDIGANVGSFSIPIAASGYRVIAIESLRPNVIRLCASMKKADLTNQLTIVYNAVTDFRENVSHLWKDTFISLSHTVNVHEGTYPIYSIILDDLLEIYNLTNVIIKIDMSGKEDKVLNGAHKFFNRVSVKGVLLTFVHHKQWISGVYIADFMEYYGLKPAIPRHAKPNYDRWSPDIILFLPHPIVTSL